MAWVCFGWVEFKEFDWCEAWRLLRGFEGWDSKVRDLSALLEILHTYLHMRGVFGFALGGVLDITFNIYLFF